MFVWKLDTRLGCGECASEVTISFIFSQCKGAESLFLKRNSNQCKSSEMEVHVMIYQEEACLTPSAVKGNSILEKKRIIKRLSAVVTFAENARRALN